MLCLYIMAKLTTLFYCILLCTYSLVNSVPTKRELLNVIPRVSSQWYGLGLMLLKEEQESHLDIIRSNHAGDKKNCCKDMFWYWLSTNPGATWQELIKALRSPFIGLPVVAANLEKKLIGTVVS